MAIMPTSRPPDSHPDCRCFPIQIAALQIPGRRGSRAQVIAASLTDDDIDRLIKRAQKEVEPLLG